MICRMSVHEMWKPGSEPNPSREAGYRECPKLGTIQAGSLYTSTINTVMIIKGKKGDPFGSSLKLQMAISKDWECS